MKKAPGERVSRTRLPSASDVGTNLPPSIQCSQAHVFYLVSTVPSSRSAHVDVCPISLHCKCPDSMVLGSLVA